MVKAATIAVGLAMTATAGIGITYNSSGSVPVGLYRIRPLRGEPARGDVVGVCLSGAAAELARRRGYVHTEGLEPWIYGVRCAGGLTVIGKPVAGVPSDTVEVRPDGVFINGRRLPNGLTPSRDRMGRPIPHPARGTRILGRDEFWIQSPYTARSYDSRIFGPIRRSQIVDRRVPLLTR